MNQPETLRNKVLLSLQRALLGEVSAFLRGVTCSWDNNQIRILCLFDGEISDDDQESMDCIETEVMADFSDITVSLKSIRLDYPELLNSQTLTDWVYRRKEP
jgi:hypothetical protein